jgi:hypothetical protein
MTYAKKYTIPFKQMKDYDGYDGWNIDIYADGHGGGVTTLYTEQNSIVLQRDGGQFEWVNGTKLSFGLYNLTEEQYKEFRDASFGDYYCLLVRSNSEQVFLGYNQSEIYTESYSDVPYSAKLEFTCGLSHLKYVRFDNSGTLYTGQKSLIEVIRLCLNKLPNPVFGVREFINEFDDSMSNATTNSMLNQTFVDVTLYREVKDGVTVGFTCHQVLMEILKCFNSHLFQYGFIWQIIRWQEYSDSTMYYRDFDARVGTESTITIDDTGNLTTNKRVAGQPDGTSTELVITESTELSIEVPLNRIRLTYNQEQQNVSNFQLLQNGCIGNFTPNNYTGNPTEWTYQGIDPDTYNALFPVNTINWFQFTDINSGSYLATKYIKQTRANLYIATTDRLKIELKGYQSLTIDKDSASANFNDINGFLNGNWYRYYPVIIKIGAYYLQQTGSNSGTWGTTPNVFIISMLNSNYQMPFWLDTYDVESYDTQYIYTSVLPLSGFQDIEMTFLQPYSNVVAEDTLLTDFTLTVNNFGITCMSVVYEPDQSAAITDYVVYQEIDEDEEVLELDIMHGDGLYDFSQNSFRLSTGVVTNNWNRRGKTDNLTIFEQILKQYAELRGSFVKMLSANIITQMQPYNTIEHTVNGTAYHYMIQDYSYKLETNEWDVNLMEIADYTSIVPDVTTTYKLLTAPLPIVDNSDLTDNQNGVQVIEDSTKIYTTQNDINNYV